MSGQKSKPVSYEKLVKIINKWLLIKDDGFIKVVVATLLSNYFDADPVWLFIVAPSGGAKTELLNGLVELANVHFISDITPQALLSGFKGDEAGLLDRVGKFGIVVMKDFTSVLTMNKDKRHEIMSKLREIFDGQVSKAFGNGITREWSGKIGIFAAVTTVIDQHQGIYQTLGERFVQYRPVSAAPVDVAKKAIDNIGFENEMRSEIREAFKGFVENFEVPKKPPIVSEYYKQRMIQLATFCATARSGITRDSYGSRDISFVPEPELPTRLAKQFMTLFCALSLLSSDFTEQDFSIIQKVAFDSLTTVRSRIIRKLLLEDDSVSLTALSSELGLTRTNVRRKLEDLEALGIVECDANEFSGLAINYWISPKAKQWILGSEASSDKLLGQIKQIFGETIVPEMLEGEM